MRATRSRTKLAQLFHFLALPAELRLNIYKLLLLPRQNSSDSNPVFTIDSLPRARYAGLSVDWSLSPADKTESTSFASITNAAIRQVMAEKKDIFLQILLVCRFIHDEAFPIFYNNHRFLFAATGIRSETLDFERDFLNKLTFKKISQLRHLEFEDRWNGVGFFSASAFVKFLGRHKDLLNLDSCILFSKFDSQDSVFFHRTVYESYKEYQNLLWNMNIRETKGLWEAGLMIKDIMPKMTLSRQQSSVHVGSFSSGCVYLTFEVILRKDGGARRIRDGASKRTGFPTGRGLYGGVVQRKHEAKF